jgi:hypothetical protein
MTDAWEHCSARGATGSRKRNTASGPHYRTMVGRRRHARGAWYHRNAARTLGAELEKQDEIFGTSVPSRFEVGGAPSAKIASQEFVAGSAPTDLWLRDAGQSDNR